VALAVELPLTDARLAIADLSSRGAVSVDLDGTCGVCSRRQAGTTA
jgi:Fe-S cluster biogenesis protein NfuA